MTMKPFEIQSPALSINGVLIDTSAQGKLVIPGVTKAGTYVAIEVDDTEDQTYNWGPESDPTLITIIDGYRFAIENGELQAQVGWTPATYAAEAVDDEGFIDGINVVTGGTGYSGEATTYSRIMFATQTPDAINNWNPFDWQQIPFSVRCGAGEIESEFGGGGSANLGNLEVTDDNNLQSGDTQNFVNFNASGRLRLGTMNNDEVVVISNFDGSTKDWRFKPDGGLQFPDGTTQYSATASTVLKELPYSVRLVYNQDGAFRKEERHVTEIDVNIMTSIFNGDNDDDFVEISSLPFNIAFTGDDWDKICVGTNSYITFGRGTSNYNFGDDPTMDGEELPAIIISEADNSYQNVYTLVDGAEGSRLFSVRYEGTNDTEAVAGSPNMVWQITFYEATPDIIDMLIIQDARGAQGISGITNGSNWCLVDANGNDIPRTLPWYGLNYTTLTFAGADITQNTDTGAITVGITGGGANLGNLSVGGSVIQTSDSAAYINFDAGDGDSNEIAIGTNDGAKVKISTSGGASNFEFLAASNNTGSITFPDGSVQTTAYTAETVGTGELYIMANVDGTIITSTDGITWSEPISSGVPTYGGGGPFNLAISKVEIHGGVIVYTRGGTDGPGPGGTGLYYSTEIGTATLCTGTDSDPGGDLYWNEVHFFSETDKWVAVGFSQYQQDSKKPIYAYSTDGIAWTVCYVDINFVADHNVGNWSWEMTDVAYNPTELAYVFVGKVGGDNHAGAFVTNDLTVTFDANIWVDIPLNAKSIVNFNVVQFGGPPGYMMMADADANAVWTTYTSLTNPNNWSPTSDSLTSGWYQTPMIDNFGYVPSISEMTANGTTIVITTVDGQVAVPGMGMAVTIPQVYTSDITNIVRNDPTVGPIDTFTVPAVGSQNTYWTAIPFDMDVTVNGDTFHVVIDGDAYLTSCTLVASDSHSVDDIISLRGSHFGGADGSDDIVITVTGILPTATTIEFSDNNQDGNKITPASNGEKITISGVTSHTENGSTTEQSYNGTYYIKTINNSGNPSTYELYTDQALTQPWDTSTYWPVDTNTGTLTWSHGQYFDAAGCANSYYYIGNDDEQIFRSTDGGFTWVEQTDLTGGWLNDFAYGTFGTVSTIPTQIKHGESYVRIVEADGEVSVTVNTGKHWKFTTDGSVQFPDNTKQTTAYVHRNINMDGGGAAVHYEQEVGYIDGGFSSTRHGVADPMFDGGNRLTENNQYNLDGGGA